MFKRDFSWNQTLNFKIHKLCYALKTANKTPSTPNTIGSSILLVLHKPIIQFTLLFLTCEITLLAKKKITTKNFWKRLNNSKVCNTKGTVIQIKEHIIWGKTGCTAWTWEIQCIGASVWRWKKVSTAWYKYDLRWNRKPQHRLFICTTSKLQNVIIRVKVVFPVTLLPAATSLIYL